MWDNLHEFKAHCRLLGGIFLTLLTHVIVEFCHCLANLVSQQSLLRQPHLVTAIRRTVCLRHHGASLLYAFTKPCGSCSCDRWSLPVRC